MYSTIYLPAHAACSSKKRSQERDGQVTPSSKEERWSGGRLYKANGHQVHMRLLHHNPRTQQVINWRQKSCRNQEGHSFWDRNILLYITVHNIVHSCLQIQNGGRQILLCLFYSRLIFFAIIAPLPISKFFFKKEFS